MSNSKTEYTNVKFVIKGIINRAAYYLGNDKTLTSWLHKVKSFATKQEATKYLETNFIKSYGDFGTIVYRDIAGTIHDVDSLFMVK